MHGKNYRVVAGMALTRREYVHGVPAVKIAKFTSGVASQDYDYVVQLISKERAQIRHEALEAARVAIGKKLATVGEDKYFLLLKPFPHIILKENKMIATAGADRLQEGMRKAWGKPIGLAARVEEGALLFNLHIKKENLEKAKEALRTGSTKLPVKTKIVELQAKIAT